MVNAIVLKREDFKENDQRIFMFTLQKGFVVAKVVGVKKIASKQSTRLEPGVLCYAHLHKGRQGYRLLTVEPLRYHRNVRNSYVKSMIALYVLGLFSQIIKVQQQDKQLFLLLRKFLETLDTIDESQAYVLQGVLLWKLLAVLGYNTRPSERLSDWHKQAQYVLEKSLPLPPFLHESS